MTSESTLTQRFLELPRSFRWLIYAVVVVLLFLLWDDTVRPLAEAWDRQANVIEADLKAIRDDAQLAKGLTTLRNTVVGLGEVELPSNENEGRKALSTAVVAVLGGTTHEFELGAASNLPKDLSSGLVRGDGRLKRLTGNVQFTATPEETINIIAAFENRPEIEAITSVRINKIPDQRKLKVRLTLESWIEA